MLLAVEHPPLRRAGLEILQANLGYLCNQRCTHCHVNAGPHRTELMDAETVDLLLEVIERRQVQTLDLTGGAPELNPHFRSLVRRARALGVHVIDRCNLTVLLEPGQEDCAEFLADQGVHIVASLPCYIEENVDGQRGAGVYNRSIEGLQRLNRLGYGLGQDAELQLDLVYNPQGPHLPPPQDELQRDYQVQLRERFGIRFNRLLTITNLPIARFGAVLLAQGQFHSYMDLLREAHVPANLAGVMCRTTVSVDYRGYLYDCDFNQMLNMPMGDAGTGNETATGRHLNDLLEDEFRGAPIAVAGHCYACSAGQGSSCGGALDAAA